MVRTAYDFAIFYGVSSIIDAAGALFAIRSKEMFEFEEIAHDHERVEHTASL